jgi:uncharacterized protein YeaO (DUF488 family)
MDRIKVSQKEEMCIVKSVSSGYVITASISSIKNIVCDEVWQITRSNKYISGAKWVPGLAPSSTLYRRFINEWKDRHGDEWWHTYKVQFEKELQTNEKLNALRRLCNLVKTGKVIALVCFCRDSQYCHRTLVGDFLRQQGIRAKEYEKEMAENNYEQLTLF